ncbi:MAG: 5'-nucleotidase C-terminal domain-containing protein [Atopobiaceae bacterium]|nr:5'-nucleotidase C-terminal domain-containing protein [Atopobiaceae bacterium]
MYACQPEQAPHASKPMRRPILTRRQALGTTAAATAAALGACAAPAADDLATPPSSQAIRILATSDLHGKMVPWDYPINEESRSGSMAQLATAIASLRDDNTLLIDAGDSIQDNMAELFADDEVHPMIAALNVLRYDVGVTGNHEYNFGMDVLRRAISSFSGKTLVGNVTDEHGDPLADAYTILTVGDVRIGVIGMVTPNIVKWDATNLDGCDVRNPIAETRRVIDLIAPDVDVLVGAFHMSLDNEYNVPGSGVRDIIAACPELDVVIAAHEHRLVEGETVGNTLVVENRWQAQTMSCIDLICERTDDGWRVARKESRAVAVADFEPDPEVMELMAPYDERARTYAIEPVGKLTGGSLAPEAEIAGIPSTVLQDTPLIDLVGSVLLHYSRARVASAAPCTVDANMSPGTIRRCDISKLYRFGNTLYTVLMTGAQLRTYLEWSAAAYKQWQPGDLTIAFADDAQVYNIEELVGANYTLDVSRPMGERVRDLAWPDDTPVADDDVFELAVSNYRANMNLLTPGTVFAEGDPLPKLVAADLRSDIGSIRELIADYIENVCGGVAEATCDDSWRLVGNDWDLRQHERAVDLLRDGSIVIADEDKAHGLCTRAITVDDLPR